MDLRGGEGATGIVEQSDACRLRGDQSFMGFNPGGESSVSGSLRLRFGMRSISTRQRLV
jgi:hypothetical protein